MRIQLNWTVIINIRSLSKWSSKWSCWLIAPSTLGAHPLPFSPLPSPHLSPSPPHQSPILASLPFPSPLLPSLPALLASLHSLLLHNRQVAQCSVPRPFLADIACHYVSLCRSLISPSPSLHFPAATGESTWDPGVFIVIIIFFPYWWLSYNKLFYLSVS